MCFTVPIQSSVWSQLLPSIVGGIIGATATVLATKSTIEATAKQSKIDDERRRINEEHDKQEQAKNWIHAEIVQINEMIKDIPRSRKFPNQAWESTKMHLYAWKPKEQKTLINLYNIIALYNEEVNYGIYGQGIQRNHAGQLHSITTKLRPALTNAIKTLGVVTDLSDYN